MELNNKLAINRAFRDNADLAKNIYLKKDLETNLSKLAEITGLNKNFVSINRDKIMGMAFTIVG